MSEARVFKVGDAVRTRDGRKARIVCDDRKSEYREARLVVLITRPDGNENVASFGENGRLRDATESEYDLVPAPRTRTVWVTWWPVTPERPEEFTANDGRHGYTAFGRNNGALACIKVELEEGRFDE